MLHDLMRLVLNVLLPLLLFAGWLVAECRSHRAYVRLSLGLGCLLVLVMWLLAVINSANIALHLHRSGLYRIERELQEEGDTRVLRSIRVYDEVYRETQSMKRAASAMNNALLEPISNGGAN